MRLLPLVLLSALSLPAHADEHGKTGVSTTGCGGCHGRSADATTSVSFATSSTTVNAGDRVLVQLVVATTSGTRTYGGLDVSATGGSLAAGSNTSLSRSEITHSSPVAMSRSSVTFDFYWTAPAAAGIYSLRGAGNAVNHDGADSGDGWNLATNLSMTVCADVDGDGVSTCDGDCNDASASAYPGAYEVCNSADDDCDGTVDETPSDGVAFYPDGDGDGYGSGADSVIACSAPSGYTGLIGDCDDADPSRSPGVVEVCDSGRVDEDCDGMSNDDDPSVTGTTTYYLDADADFHGDPAVTVQACLQPSGYTQIHDDCDDGDSGVFPGASETCDGVDSNCDGLIGGLDADVDGWTECYDCNDTNAGVNPDATEVCNGLDDDCDGSADGADAVGAVTWYADGDNDGYGDPGASEVSCTGPFGWVSAGGDCDDVASSVNPGATEVCDPADVDQDCDGLVDDADPSVAGQVTRYVDADGDGYGSASSTLLTCDPVSGYSDIVGDCDDSTSAITTGSAEVCNGLDDDCDGVADDGFTTVWYTDADGDGYGDDTTLTVTCTPADGSSAVGGDCDDADAVSYPDAEDAWYDGIDANCDGADDYDADEDGADSADYGGDDCDDADDLVYVGAPEDCSATVDYNCDGSIGAADADGDGYSACTDCNDASATANPGASEACNAADDDCDGVVDDGLAVAESWPDRDEDGYGDSAADPFVGCAVPLGYVDNHDDCDDTDPALAADCSVDTGDTAVDTGDSGGDTAVDSGDTSDTGDTETDSDTDTDADTDTDSGSDTSTDTDDTAGDPGGDDTADTGKGADTGCGCAAGAASPSGSAPSGLAWLSGALAALVLGRRRARNGA